ncbi:ATP-binding cassette domain-containing protein [candidate division KSB1 bacterium]|nr:ATP-binding cassette domain-containing protein [candidate division KSB1 bacterium]
MSLHLELENIYYRYRGIAASQDHILRGISFEVRPRECVALVGPSGSGKTTLIQHFTGLLKPDRGHIRVDGENIWSRKYDFVNLRRRIGLVFQFPEGQLFEESVEKDVAFAPSNLGLAQSEIDKRVSDALTAVGLPYDQFAARSPFSLSAGEKRRVAIAGILAMNPELIVFDEPTAGMDPKGVGRMKSLIRQLLQKGHTCMIISHHMDFISAVARRVLVLINGKLIFDDTVGELFKNNTVMERASLEQSEFRQALLRYQSCLPAELLHTTHWEEFHRKLSNLNLRQKKS